MKYRIKIINYSDGSVEYWAQKRILPFIWMYLYADGGICLVKSHTFAETKREGILERIDLSIKDNTRKVISIQFEYINK